ncbi:hypothetical protein [Melissospora conviva]|uniref:hypothetical protein n=1 Tax=Melissospora conviva TaxID=3388432 RepID=UPI003C1530E7
MSHNRTIAALQAAINELEARGSNPASAESVASDEPKPRKYRYYVSYAHAHGFGGIEVTLDQPINGMKDIKYVQRLAAREVVQPIVITWQQFDR